MSTAGKSAGAKLSIVYRWVPETAYVQVYECKETTRVTIGDATKSSSKKRTAGAVLRYPNGNWRAVLGHQERATVLAGEWPEIGPAMEAVEAAERERRKDADERRVRGAA